MHRYYSEMICNAIDIDRLYVDVKDVYCYRTRYTTYIVQQDRIIFADQHFLRYPATRSLIPPSM